MCAPNWGISVIFLDLYTRTTWVVLLVLGGRLLRNLRETPTWWGAVEDDSNDLQRARGIRFWESWTLPPGELRLPLRTPSAPCPVLRACAAASHFGFRGPNLRSPGRPLQNGQGDGHGHRLEHAEAWQKKRRRLRLRCRRRFGGFQGARTRAASSSCALPDPFHGHTNRPGRPRKQRRDVRKRGLPARELMTSHTIHRLNCQAPPHSHIVLDFLKCVSNVGGLQHLLHALKACSIASGSVHPSRHSRVMEGDHDCQGAGHQQLEAQ